MNPLFQIFTQNGHCSSIPNTLMLISETQIVRHHIRFKDIIVNFTGILKSCVKPCFWMCKCVNRCINTAPCVWEGLRRRRLWINPEGVQHDLFYFDHLVLCCHFPRSLSVSMPDSSTLIKLPCKISHSQSLDLWLRLEYVPEETLKGDLKNMSLVCQSSIQ